MCTEKGCQNASFHHARSSEYLPMLLGVRKEAKEPSTTGYGLTLRRSHPWLFRACFPKALERVMQA